jgi:hypothetical protein
MAIIIFVKKIQTKNLFPTGRAGQTGFFEYVCLYFNDDHSSIHFIQNLLLNSNLKSDIQKNI